MAAPLGGEEDAVAAVPPAEGDWSRDRKGGMRSWGSVAGTTAPHVERVSRLPLSATWSANAALLQPVTDSAVGSGSNNELVRYGILTRRGCVDCSRSVWGSGERRRTVQERKQEKASSRAVSRRQYPKNESPARRGYRASVGCHDNIAGRLDAGCVQPRVTPDIGRISEQLSNWIAGWFCWPIPRVLGLCAVAPLASFRSRQDETGCR